MENFEWDPEKEDDNLRKHSVDFELASLIWDGVVYEQRDDRKDYGEERFIAMGTVESRLIVVVYTWRGSIRRLISARKGNEREQKIFRKGTAGRNGDPPD
jgi:uncharacterized DUF497 family protein